MVTPRSLPSVDRLAAAIGDGLPGPIAIEIARGALDDARRRIAAGESPDVAAEAEQTAARLRLARPRRVINATGVLLHTNLGRAPLGSDAAEAAREAAAGYGTVEFDLASGGRGERGAYVAALLRALTGAEAALVVNNAAGALLLSLAALAAPGRVIVARGELIEIGGSFRLPDLMAASGATLGEVGTTNRTRPGDYAAAVAGARALLKVHPSNYRVEGFTEEATYRDLAVLGAEHQVPLIADVGSGLLDTRCPWLEGPPPGWLGAEPGVRQTLEAGAGVVLFSGDKLLGGPQAGLAVGRSDLIDRMARHPVARALRVDGPTLAALAVTLEAYARGRGRDVPFWRMATEPREVLDRRSRALVAASGIDAAIVDGTSTPGAGTVPGQSIVGPVVRLAGSSDGWFHDLLRAPIPIVGRRAEGGLTLDLRTVDPADDPELIAALHTAPRSHR